MVRPEPRAAVAVRRRRAWRGRAVARSEHGGILPKRWAKEPERRARAPSPSPSADPPGENVTVECATVRRDHSPGGGHPLVWRFGEESRARRTPPSAEPERRAPSPSAERRARARAPSAEPENRAPSPRAEGRGPTGRFREGLVREVPGGRRSGAEPVRRPKAGARSANARPRRGPAPARARRRRARAGGTPKCCRTRGSGVRGGV